MLKIWVLYHLDDHQGVCQQLEHLRSMVSHSLEYLKQGYELCNGDLNKRAVDT
jgi:hypothetical protein